MPVLDCYWFCFIPFRYWHGTCLGDKARKNTVDLLNYLLVKCLHILGCRIKFSGFEKIPDQRPLIIVANHQSLFDIPAIVHGFRKYYPKFISKKELSTKSAKYFI